MEVRCAMYVKIIDGNYILGVANAPYGNEITELEYSELTEIFHAMPVPRTGFEYKLTVGEKWVEVPIEGPQYIDDTDALNILLGGDTE